MGMNETAVCVVDDKGKVALETTVVTDPEVIKVALRPFIGRLRRVGHEAGALSPWLHPELPKLSLPAVCLETQHVRAAMAAQRNKTDAAMRLALPTSCAPASSGKRISRARLTIGCGCC